MKNISIADMTAQGPASGVFKVKSISMYSLTSHPWARK